jgi:hypothetical protein
MVDYGHPRGETWNYMYGDDELGVVAVAEEYLP